MSKLIVELPEQLHRELKKRAVLHHRTIKEVMTGLVEGFLSHREEKKRPRETGLCGAWQDVRAAEVIVADIKSHRRWFGKGMRKGA